MPGVKTPIISSWRMLFVGTGDRDEDKLKITD